jgi:copper(I)-binding protein
MAVAPKKQPASVDLRPNLGFGGRRAASGVRAMFGRLALLTAALTAIAGVALADDIKVGALDISAPWARATPKGATVGGGYLKITNTGTAPDRLVGGSAQISGKLEVHQMSMTGGVMKMRQVSGGLEIKPGETVEFKPGGMHIMFVGLKQQLQQGQHFQATLQFEKAGTVNVDFAIAGIGATSAGGAASAPMSHDKSHDMGGMKMK